jgi:hypothetical protein
MRKVLPTPRAPGRPTPEDAELATKRDDLAHLLSVSWADIGWPLRHASTREELREALSPLNGRGRDHLVSHFVRPSTGTTTSKEVRATRIAYKDAVAHRFDAYKRHEKVAELHSRIKLAMRKPNPDKLRVSQADLEEYEKELRLAANPDELKILQTDLVKYEEELRLAAKELDNARTQEQILKDRIEAQEASFAQEELLKIILEKRCARNPLRLAHAMAGLPLLCARVSYGRCSKLKIRSWPDFQFRVIRFIESTWNRRHRYSSLSPVELFYQEIKRLSKKVRREELPEVVAESIESKWVENNLRLHLGENWRYLRLAIEKSTQTANADQEEVDQSRIPFAIASNFSMIREEPRTALTMALAENERIDQ